MSTLPMTQASGPRWYAVSTRSRHEKHVRDHLAGHGIEPLLPLVRRLNQWKDRKKEVDSPLFPGYCFASFSWDMSLTVLRASGVVRIIGGSGKPEPIPDSEIDAVRKLDYECYWYCVERFSPHNFNKVSWKVAGIDINMVCLPREDIVSVPSGLQRVAQFSDLKKGIVPFMQP